MKRKELRFEEEGEENILDIVGQKEMRTDQSYVFNPKKGSRLPGLNKTIRITMGEREKPAARILRTADVNQTMVNRNELVKEYESWTIKWNGGLPRLKREPKDTEVYMLNTRLEQREIDVLISTHGIVHRDHLLAGYVESGKTRAFIASLLAGIIPTTFPVTKQKTPQDYKSFIKVSCSWSFGDGNDDTEMESWSFLWENNNSQPKMISGNYLNATANEIVDADVSITQIKRADLHKRLELEPEVKVNTKLDSHRFRMPIDKLHSVLQKINDECLITSSNHGQEKSFISTVVLSTSNNNNPVHIKSEPTDAMTITSDEISTFSSIAELQPEVTPSIQDAYPSVQTTTRKGSSSSSRRGSSKTNKT